MACCLTGYVHDVSAPRRIAILPFAIEEDETAQGYLADGLTDVVVDFCGGRADLVLISRESSEQAIALAWSAPETMERLEAGLLM